MPNRILKDSICRSEEIDNLLAEEEVFFYRILVNCDDYGRFDARLAILNSLCFPLKEYRDEQIEIWLKSLVANKLIRVYYVNSKPYLEVVTWNNHQQIRAKRSKYPSPDNTSNQMIADDNICPRNPIQSESNPNPIRNPLPPTSLKNKIYESFEKYAGCLITAKIAEELIDIEEEYGEEIVIAAFQKASSNGKSGGYFLSYCQPILEQYKLKGIPENRKNGGNHNANNQGNTGRELPKVYSNPYEVLAERNRERAARLQGTAPDARTSPGPASGK